MEPSTPMARVIKVTSLWVCGMKPCLLKPQEGRECCLQKNTGSKHIKSVSYSFFSRNITKIRPFNIMALFTACKKFQMKNCDFFVIFMLETVIVDFP